MHKNTYTQILEQIPSEKETIILEEQTGSNLHFVIKIVELVTNYNIGNLIIEWKLKGRKHISSTKFEDLLKIDTIQIPF